MTFMLAQAFLLMAAAYFVGAFLGCWWRRAFSKPVDVVAVEPAEAAVIAPVGGIVRVPRGMPIPVQPRIEYVAPHESLADTTRFERALSGAGGLAPAGTAAVVVPPLPPAVTPARIAVTPAARVERRLPIDPPPLPPADPDAARETDEAVAAAAAAAAAAMMVAARHRVDDKPRTPAAQRPAARDEAVRVVTPPVPAANVPAPPVAPAVPADRQDLKLIRTIDEETERALNSQGVWRYRDIAHWTARDVAAANHMLGGSVRVERENWIEQAALLVGGGLTDYARRRLRGERATSHPTAAAMPPSMPVESGSRAPSVAVARPYQPPSPAASASATAAAVAAAAASASRGIAVADRRPSPQRASVARISPVTPLTPAARPAPPQPTAAVTTPTTSVPSVPPVPVAVTAPRALDMLQRIRGIDGATERLLREAGVLSYREIADWSSEDVHHIEALLDAPGRIGHENWIEQAQILAGGSTTLYARQRDAGLLGSAVHDVPAVPHELRPSRLSDAIRDNSERSAPAVARSDVSTLRPPRPENDEDGESPADIDDLKRIRGVGVLIEKKLNSLGITSYEQIANWTAEDIEVVSELLDFRGRIERENWVEQARILWAGGATEFSRRVDRGEVT